MLVHSPQDSTDASDNWFIVSEGIAVCHGVQNKIFGFMYLHSQACFSHHPLSKNLARGPSAMTPRRQAASTVHGQNARGQDNTAPRRRGSTEYWRGEDEIHENIRDQIENIWSATWYVGHLIIVSSQYPEHANPWSCVKSRLSSPVTATHVR